MYCFCLYFYVGVIMLFRSVVYNIIAGKNFVAANERLPLAMMFNMIYDISISVA